jgi:hypothetical protein
MPGQWRGSTRRTTLPPNWNSEIRPAVRERDGGRCTWLNDLDDGGPADYLTGHYDDNQRCTQHGTDTDHIGDRDDHRIENQRLLCSWHHDRRSSKQGNTARQRYSNRRPPEQHPGLR